jgi:hypothetical protein
MNLEEIKDVTEEQKEYIKENFNESLEFISDSNDWDVSNVTIENCDEILPKLLYNDIERLLTLDDEITYFFVSKFQYIDLFTGTRQNKVKACMETIYEKLKEEYTRLESIVVDEICSIITDPNGILCYVFSKYAPELIHDFRITNKEFEEISDFYDNEPDYYLSEQILDEIQDCGHIDFQSMCNIMNYKIKEFYSKKHLKEIREENDCI